MGKRIVIALGGNALGKNLPEQMLAVKETSKAIADLVEAGHTVVVAIRWSSPTATAPRWA